MLDHLLITNYLIFIFPGKLIWSHVTLHFKRPFLDLRVITQVCSPLLELLSEFMDLIVEKPHQSPLPAIWFEENFFSSSDTRTSAHLLVSDALVYASGLLLMIILSRSRHLWSVAVHQCYGLWQKLLKMVCRNETCHSLLITLLITVRCLVTFKLTRIIYYCGR